MQTIASDQVSRVRPCGLVRGLNYRRLERSVCTACQSIVIDLCAHHTAVATRDGCRALRCVHGDV